MNGSASQADLRTYVEVELLHSLFRFPAGFGVETARNREYRKKKQSESHTGNRCDLLGEQIRHCHEEQGQCGHEQSNGNFPIAHHDVQRRFVLLIMTPESQYENSQRLHKEAPNHAERVGLTQQFHIPAARDNGRDL